MNIVLTGGTSGLGYRTAQVLGSEIKNKIILIGSNKHKGENSVKALIKETSNNTEDIIEILEKGSQAANESMLSTKEMLSKKGRSSKLGERSKGHIDPGAASSALIFRTFHEAVQNL